MASLYFEYTPNSSVGVTRLSPFPVTSPNTEPPAHYAPAALAFPFFKNVLPQSLFPSYWCFLCLQLFPRTSLSQRLLFQLLLSSHPFFYLANIYAVSNTWTFFYARNFFKSLKTLVTTVNRKDSCTQQSVFSGYTTERYHAPAPTIHDFYSVILFIIFIPVIVCCSPCYLFVHLLIYLSPLTCMYPVEFPKVVSKNLANVLTE